LRPQNKKQRRSPHQTQWAAQFAVASELCKRNYQVALTLGNHPETDLMVISPTGWAFKVDVRGLYRKNFWIVRLRPLDESLFFVLAYVPDPPETNAFVIMTHQQMRKEQLDDLARARLKRPDLDETYPVLGVPWRYAVAYQDQWSVLPA
jgi:hypothetical protein